jgi:hypothetical protein
MHHFGSMAGLRTACDEHVAAVIRQTKHNAISAGLQLDVFATLRGNTSGPLMGYLAKVLADDSAAVAELVDELVADAEGYMQEGIDAGLLQPTDDLRGRAAILMTWSLGALVLNHHLRRLLGVDLTDPHVGDGEALAAYAVPAYEILGGGILTEAFGSHLRESFSEFVDHDTAPAPGPTERTPRTPAARASSKGTR